MPEPSDIASTSGARELAAHQAKANATPYDLVGGMPVVRQIVERFYDLMEQDEAYADLRRLHAADLAPMRGSLAGFLAAWMGGPRDWFSEHPGVCMMSAHRNVPIDASTARQWKGAMERAIGDSTIDAALGLSLAAALGDLALRMAGPDAT